MKLLKEVYETLGAILLGALFGVFIAIILAGAMAIFVLILQYIVRLL